MAKIIKRIVEDRGPKMPPRESVILRCACGCTVLCDNHISDCSCGRAYFRSGQELA